MALRGKATIWGKSKYDSDIVVDGKGIELKACTHREEATFAEAFSGHPNADYYLILHKNEYPVRFHDRVVESVTVFDNWKLTLCE